ncbi:uncharacterized protein MEPE_01287 [Melanopsichium pennsylvanicum]|uniref:Origin recognition complex subunit 5 n=2 Tax=Melanopsichium pennsylvanicum TaxID=63383 RepID=A0AAJ4XIG7_9BASI|nr:conserved hypothetical protein [Melanopsichium pennsylvanicum 4]SNX82581.1 uncharacterized protein MEPE_01287 [Melanopsichium pennsylvanicum]
MASATHRHAGRADQIASLTSLLGQSGQPLPPSVLLQDACSPNTTARLVADVLHSLVSHADQDESPLCWCSVSPLTSITPATLFRSILTSLEAQVLRLQQNAHAVHSNSIAGGSKIKYRRPEASIDYFLWNLGAILDTISARLVIVINDAERIRDLWPEHIWTAFCRLALLANKPGQISTVLVSSLPWSQYRTPSGLTVSHQPITIRFPRLTRPDILSILSLDFPMLWNSYSSSIQSAQMHAGTSPSLCKRSTMHKLKKKGSGDQVTMEALRALYEQFAGVFYDSVRSNVRDVEELRTMNAAVWHSFVVPVQTKECTTADLQTLLLASSHLFKDVIVRLQTREVGPREWTQEARIKSIQNSATRLAAAKIPEGVTIESKVDEDVDMVDEERKFDEEEWLELEMAALARMRSASSQATISLLPSLALIPTFLVIASFLASYNPSRLDVRYFLRDDSLLSLSSGASKGKSLKGGRRLGPGRGRKGASAGKRGRPSKSAHRVTNEDGQTENLNRQQLLGPKPFPIDRLLSIFQALITEAAPEMSMVYSSLIPDHDLTSTQVEKENDRSTLWEYRSKSLSVYSQINGLVAKRMLVRTSAQDKLGTSINFRTNVNYNIVAVLAKRVKFDLDEWLWDWGAGGANGL